jgi:predicted phosphodiesterase
MQYAIISDIHANLQAWNSVLLDIRSQGVDKIVCLGDIVGYGPNPAEVLSSVHSEVDHFVMGNHDAVICGKMDSSLFNPLAREVIEWTREVLNQDAIEFLKQLPLAIKAPEFRCTHGEFSNPSAFNYLIEPKDALESWASVSESLLFVGHTHQRGIHILGDSGAAHWVDAQDFEIEDGKRYIVNVGSVGQPRDGETRASYAILETDPLSIYWRRIPFDIDGYAAALERSGIARGGSCFLDDDPRSGKPPVRELLDFSPASSKEEAVSGVVEVEELDSLRKGVRKWKVATVATLSATIIALSLGGGMTWRYAERGVVIRDVPLASAYSGSGSELAHVSWNLCMGDGRNQSYRPCDNPEDGVTLYSETTKDELRMQTSLIRAHQKDRFCVEAMFKKHKDFSGTIAMVVTLVKADGETIDQYVVKEPNQLRKGGWLLGKQTFDIPAGVVSMSFQVRGKFKGEVTIKGLLLRRSTTS